MRLMYQGPTIDAVHFRLWLGKRVILYACCRSSRAVPSMELPFTFHLFLSTQPRNAVNTAPCMICVA